MQKQPEQSSRTDKNQRYQIFATELEQAFRETIATYGFLDQRSKQSMLIRTLFNEKGIPDILMVGTNHNQDLDRPLGYFFTEIEKIIADLGEDIDCAEELWPELDQQNNLYALSVRTPWAFLALIRFIIDGHKDFTCIDNDPSCDTSPKTLTQISSKSWIEKPPVNFINASPNALETLLNQARCNQRDSTLGFEAH